METWRKGIGNLEEKTGNLEEVKWALGEPETGTWRKRNGN